VSEPLTLSLVHAHSPTHARTHSFTHSHFHSLIHSLTHPLTHALIITTRARAHTPHIQRDSNLDINERVFRTTNNDHYHTHTRTHIHTYTHTRACALTASPSLFCTHTHSFVHSLTHSLTHSPTPLTEETILKKNWNPIS
jgi:hypothetical protein